MSAAERSLFVELWESAVAFTGRERGKDLKQAGLTRDGSSSDGDQPLPR